MTTIDKHGALHAGDGRYATKPQPPASYDLPSKTGPGATDLSAIKMANGTPDLRTRRSDLPRDERGHRTFDPHVPGIPGDGSPVVLDTDEERGLTFTWFDISRHKRDWQSRERGYLVSQIEVTDSEGNEVGHLNITHTTPELVAAELPTPFHWADENTGASFGYDWNDEVSLQKVWASAYSGMQQRPPSMEGKRVWTPSESDAPTDPDVLAAELDAAEAYYAERVEAFTRFLSVPFVDYSKLAETVTDPSGGTVPLRGTGTGQRMYRLAARKLAEQGKVLRASGLQSPEAEAVWARLVGDPDVPTREIEVTLPHDGEKRTYMCIDYR